MPRKSPGAAGGATRIANSRIEVEAKGLSFDQHHRTVRKGAHAQLGSLQVASELVARGADAGGITWHYVRPPIVDLDYEMDCRSVALERIA